MKTSLILAVMLVGAVKLVAQPNQNTNAAAKSIALPPRIENPLVLKPQQPNEIQGRRVTYSGMTVQVIKAKNPLQLVNPFAPMEYGSGEMNLDRDIITGKPTGFKLFSIKF